MLDAGAPIDGIGLQSHFDSNLTPPSRVLELIDQFAAFGKDLQVTEFDVSVADEQVQADYTRDFLTICFSHPAMKGFMIWGFWEGAHWKPSAAMIRRNWSTKPNYDAWNDLIYRQWWTDTRGVTAADGVFRTRAFLGDYDIEVTIDGVTKTYPLRLTSNTEPAFVNIGKASAGRSRSMAWSTPRPFAAVPWRQGRSSLFSARDWTRRAGSRRSTRMDGFPPASARPVCFSMARPPHDLCFRRTGERHRAVLGRGSARVQVEYQGTLTAPVLVTVAAAAPGIFACPNKPSVALAINASAGGVLSCNGDFVPPSPGSVVTFYVTGDGIPAPAIDDGRLPAGPPYAAPASWNVNIGGVDAPLCAATFAGPGLRRRHTSQRLYPRRCVAHRHGTRHIPIRRRIEPCHHHRPALITLALILKV